MSSSDDFAAICPLAAVNATLVGKKIRVAGKILSYDPITHLLLLTHHPYGILVDMTLCLDPAQSLHYLSENKGTLMVVGSLDRTLQPLEVPVLSRFVEAPSLDDQVVLRAIVARSVNDLSLTRWCVGIEATKQTMRPLSGPSESMMGDLLDLVHFLPRVTQSVQVNHAVCMRYVAI